MKKILIPAFAFILLLNLANAESNENETKRNANNIRSEIKQEYSESYESFINNGKDINLYTGTTGDSNIDNQIISLRESYALKLKALQDQYKIDLKNIIGTRTLTTKDLPSQASATATAAVNKEHPNDEKVESKGFFEKIKNWLGIK